MADAKISALGAVTTLASADVIPCVASNVTRKITKDNLIQTLGIFAQEVFVAREDQTANTIGGDATAGDWRTRTINTLEQKTTGNVTLSTNVLTIPAGKWLLYFSAPAYECGAHRARIILDELGTPAYVNGSSSANSGGNTTLSFGFSVVDYSSSFTAKVQHQVTSTRVTWGFGRPANFGTEVYTQVIGIRIGDAS